MLLSACGERVDEGKRARCGVSINDGMQQNAAKASGISTVRTQKQKNLLRQGKPHSGVRSALSALYLCDCQMYNRSVEKALLLALPGLAYRDRKRWRTL
jgi:hypothetical protein